jgi:hypothetical protein
MIAFPLPQLEPAPEAVHAALGLRGDARPSPRADALLQRALAIFRATAAPQAVTLPLTAPEFAAVFRGRGLNAPDTPLAGIFPAADRLDLFAFTLGQGISAEIERLFAGDFALGAVLDAVASLAADNAGRVAEGWAESQPVPAAAGPRRAFLYSPGYCGWHISGQEALFAALRPEAIGIRLNDSFLMTPLKSISGVLVLAPAASHRIAATYPFCAQCQSPACRERIPVETVP